MLVRSQRTQRIQRTQRVGAVCARVPVWARVPDFSRFLVSVSFVSFVSLVAGAPAPAQVTGAPAAGYKLEPGMASGTLPAPLREIGFDQNIDQPVPLDTTFRDEEGRTVRLADFFGERPVVMVFAYFDCPMLCTQVVHGLTSALGVLSLEPHKDFEILTVSFNPADSPASASAKKTMYLDRYKRAGAAAGWHFLTGDQASIDRLTKAAGFRYAWDADTKQFAHPSGVIVLTPGGRLARYLFGIEYSPRDLRFALVEASSGRVGSRVDALLLYCYHYDPMTGRYGFVIMRLIRLAGAATVLALAAFIIVMIRRERAAPAYRPPPAAPAQPGPAAAAGTDARVRPDGRVSR
jgi:protein SCO1/2